LSSLHRNPMSDAIITVENLSKKYLVGHKSGNRSRSNYIALRDVIGREVRNIARKTIDIVQGRQVVQGDEVEEFWALKDVGFELARGEVLGIIGRNGAGKSTLLKILSRITEPTQGRVTLRGRVASLLEVGTGFHPELTGRENIFLNGAILGMTRAEIRKKFDEIVAFAEVETFLDTPVKRYSSGMYVRLAFAVAAHLEPEILVVDEVLAVGDAEFQTKCLGKMSNVASGGRTVLFVSHNMGAVRTLTTKSILLDHGSIAAAGDTESVISTYLTKALNARLESHTMRDLGEFRRRRDYAPGAKIVAIRVNGDHRDQNGEAQIELGTKFTIDVHLAVDTPMKAADCCIYVKSSMGEIVACLWCSDTVSGLSIGPGERILRVTAEHLMPTPGRYFVEIHLDPIIGGAPCDVIEDYPLFSVANTGQISRELNRRWGVIYCNSTEWQVIKLPAVIAQAAEASLDIAGW
jgi:lipopolysaccharide transport system ATP-binding protein